MSELAIRQPEIDVAMLLQKIVESGVTADAAMAVKELVLLHEHRQDRESKRDFMEAFSKARASLKTIPAEKAIPGSDNTVRWYYTPLEDLQDAVEPILEMNDLTGRWTTRREGSLCIGVYILSHIGGHEITGECAINATNAKGGDLGASKIAARGAMTRLLGLKTRHMQDDVRVLGDFITAEQGEKLRLRVLGLGGDRSAAFLKFAGGAVSFDKIRQGRYAECEAYLTKAERQRSKPGESKGSLPADASNNAPASPV